MSQSEKLIANMVEIEFVDNPEDGFFKVIETLTRIGIPSSVDKILFQSCHVLHKKGKYYIAHFKELYALDGKATEISLDDIARRNFICKLLQDWGLVKIVDTKTSQYPMADLSCVKILKHSEKNVWTTKQKYNIGIRKN